MPVPQAPGVLLSRYEVLSVSVRHAFFATRLGLSLGGCGFMDVLRWVPKMRKCTPRHTHVLFLCLRVSPCPGPVPAPCAC